MSARPWYAWYVGDARAKMRRLTLAEKGAYRELLDEVYATGEGLPESIDECCRIAGASNPDECAAVGRVIERFFPMNGDGTRHNKRADLELVRQSAFIESQREKGRAGAAARWQKDSSGHSNGHFPANGPGNGLPHPQTISTATATSTNHRESNSTPRIRKKHADIAAFALPEGIPELQWNAWIEARTQRRNPPTDFAMRMACAKLARLKIQGHEPAAVLAQSAFRGWAGLFPMKDDQ